MNKKEFSLKYYKGISRILIPYTIISVITLITKIFLSKYGIFPVDKFNHYINDFIDFKLIGYAWYVDMYIGLFLLIPFLNKMVTNKTNHVVLICTLLFLTLLPSLCSSPTFIISRWTSLWILTYYFIGAYISKYDINLSKYKIGLFYVLALLLFVFINLLSTKGKTWNVHNIDSWGGFENTITSTLFFMLFLKINFSHIPNKIKNLISGIAKLSLGIYLSSYIFDKIIYYYFNQFIINTPNKLIYFGVIVSIVFCCSILLAKISNLIETKIINKLIINKLKN